MKFLIFVMLWLGFTMINDKLKEANMRACEIVAYQNHAADQTETSAQLAQHIQECRKP